MTPSPTTHPDQDDGNLPPLPQGWIRTFSNSQRRYYYSHNETKHTQWHFPTASEAADPCMAQRRALDNQHKQKQQMQQQQQQNLKKRPHESSKSSSSSSSLQDNQDPSKKPRSTTTAATATTMAITLQLV